jgi:drug/metabolite transporter (DMT)-like permease
MKTYVAAVLTMILLSFGQVLLKLLAVKVGATGMTFANLRRDALDFVWLGAGVFLVYLAVFGCWLYTLKSLDLHRAFAFAALTFVFVPLLSYLILHEKVTIGTVAGGALIISGILVSANF